MIDRRTLLDDDAQQRLERFGYAVIPFLDDADVARLRALYDDTGPAPDDPGVALYFGFHSKSSEYKTKVGDALREALSGHVEATCDDHRVYLAMFITKWPGPDSGFGAHQDPTLLDERRFRGVSIWTPLVDTGVDGSDNGMLHVVAGSHEFGVEARVRDVNHSIYADVQEEILERHGVGIPTRLGEAIVFDDRLIHYSMPNQTADPRPVVTLGIRPAEARCVLVRDDGDPDTLNMYEVPDESFIDVIPSAQHLWKPDTPVVAVLPRPTRRVTPDELASRCAAVGPAPGAVPGRRPSQERIDIDPGAFCAFCGARDDLLESDRSGLGKAQLMCRSCDAERGSGARRPAAGQDLTAAGGIRDWLGTIRTWRPRRVGRAR